MPTVETTTKVSFQNVKLELSFKGDILTDVWIITTDENYPQMLVTSNINLDGLIVTSRGKEISYSDFMLNDLKVDYKI